jgi:hypothetical protein
MSAGPQHCHRYCQAQAERYRLAHWIGTHRAQRLPANLQSILMSSYINDEEFNLEKCYTSNLLATPVQQSLAMASANPRACHQ